ncbi:hypothetical protein SAMN05444372_11079 [Flavobacterium micromati]|uniref:Uncharacterized protein n=1 Tax=Flavobacterium micromati TaxID=229205 RepID=A0A1M5MXG4_9FLAO|nr:hypothetical protein SAMN05444372_11079 [Flavobacterium micromati]
MKTKPMIYSQQLYFGLTTCNIELSKFFLYIYPYKYPRNIISLIFEIL